MAGTTSSISIASNALLLLGHEPISSFTDGTTGATIAANLYETSYLATLSNHRWRFATKTQQLARLAETPIIDGYKYAYQLPSDLLYLQSVNEGSTDNYNIYEKKLYTNETNVIIDYTYHITEDRLPPYFTKMLEFYLASQFALSLTGDMQKGEYFSRMYLNEIRRAKWADSTQQPQNLFVESAYVEARY